MKKALKLSFYLTFLAAVGWLNNTYAQLSTAEDGEYTYEFAENDPLKTRIYTLDNGLKVYMSVNKDEPRIQTLIAVRAGCKEDPRDNTGLAHYLEHMLFKGTKNIGTNSWEEETKLLKRISDLYEQHKATTDAEEKLAIYAQIDSLSYEASKLAIPNEYDKMISSLGAKYTNAYTSTDETVYINDIPANELERWIMLEAERFNQLVLRLFHTELETVYEEFNMGQDRDNSKVYQAMLTNLFPTHPYNISTIGLGEHLKNPSMEAIHDFFNTYYVPNNMAICLSGDFDPSSTIQLIDKQFGKMKARDFERPVKVVEAPMTEHKEVTVMGKEAESVSISFRFDGAGSEDAMYLRLMDYILQNGQAGLMDINLIQKQKILKGGAYQNSMNDYSTHTIYGVAREGQSLEEVRDLLMAQIDNLKQGKFEEWMIDAVIKNFKLSELKRAESNWGRASLFVDSFITGVKWDEYISQLSKFENISKEDIMKFAQNGYLENYVVVFKKQGEDDKAMKVEKPPITQIELNRDDQSPFYQKFDQKGSARLEPAFLDYKNAIQTTTLSNGIQLNYIENTINPTFNLYYIFDMGTNNSKEMGLAIQYLPYLGTSKYSAEELQQEFYKLGMSFDVFSSADRLYVTLSGLEDAFEEGLQLFEHILANVEPNEEALNNMIADILKGREDAKLDKRTIFWQALNSYAKYGEFNEFTNIMSEEELKNYSAEKLVAILKSLTTYKHYVFYYGQNDIKQVGKALNTHHKVTKQLKPYPEAAVYKEQTTQKDKVLFVNYDMVQAQVAMMSKGEKFNKDLMPYSRVFGEYFGSGLSSIVFQEIREARALAYSAFSYFSTPNKPDKSHYTVGFMAVQADKMKDAVTAMRDLLNEMPVAEAQFNNSVNSVQKKIETERITKTRIFFDYLRNRDKGIDYDVRKDMYEKVQNMSIKDLNNFFVENISGQNYTFMVIGNKESLDMEYLKSLGEFEEVTLEQIFGY